MSQLANPLKGSQYEAQLTKRDDDITIKSASIFNAGALHCGTQLEIQMTIAKHLAVNLLDDLCL